MGPSDMYYLFCFVLDVCFAVGSGVLYTTAIRNEDRLVAGCSAVSFALGCVGSAFFFAWLV